MYTSAQPAPILMNVLSISHQPKRCMAELHAMRQHTADIVIFVQFYCACVPSCGKQRNHMYLCKMPECDIKMW